MKKIFILTAAICLLVLCFAACTEKKTYEGEDEYGRRYGETYDVDSQKPGVFRLPYSISGTSAVGKAMIAANCADYVTLEVTDDGCLLGFLCKKAMLGAVKIIAGDGTVTDGEESERDGYQVFTFRVTRETLDGKIALSCEVTVMKKTVGFEITPDLTEAKLIG